VSLAHAGVVFLPPLGEVMVLIPPLTITGQEIDNLAAALAAAIPEGCR
jgi:adenosylmethionine-8-amino-7-oxononanoate aminotransferase